MQVSIMEIKDITKPAVTISEDASLKEAVTRMVEEKTNALLVIDTEGKLVGEVTVSELLKAIVPDYLDDDGIAAHFVSNEMFEEAVTHASDKLVKFFMSTRVTPVHMDDELMLVAVKAIAKKQVRIPVVDESGKPVAIISRRGLKHIIGHTLGVPDRE